MDTISKARTIWAGMNDSEKHGVAFGLFPNEPMAKADGEGYNGKDLAVALMAISSKGCRFCGEDRTPGLEVCAGDVCRAKLTEATAAKLRRKRARR